MERRNPSEGKRRIREYYCAERNYDTVLKRMLQPGYSELFSFNGESLLCPLEPHDTDTSPQIPSYHTLLDRIDYLLCPEQGLLSVVDFYTAGKTPSLHEKGMCVYLSYVDEGSHDSPSHRRRVEKVWVPIALVLADVGT